MSATLVDMGKHDRQADKDADFSAYMSARQTALYRTAYLLAGDHAAAEDLLQTAFAKLYLSWDRIRDREALDGYVRRIMVNENNSLWRRAWKRREHATDTMPETGAVDVYDDGMGGALWSFVQTLPPKQRSVVVLRYYEQLSEAEIADVLGDLRRDREVAGQPRAGRAPRPCPAVPQPPRVRRRCTMSPTPLEDQVHDALHRTADPLHACPVHRRPTYAVAPVGSSAAAPRWPAPRSPPSLAIAVPRRLRHGRVEPAQRRAARRPSRPRRRVTGTVRIDPLSADAVAPTRRGRSSTSTRPA